MPAKRGHDAVEITHPDKVLFPADGITKGELIEYYRRIAPRMLPHLRGRPLSIERYPNGIGSRGFFQQKASDYFPDWLDTATLPKQGGEVAHVVVNDVRSLVYLANQSVVTPHAWLSRAEAPDHPDQMVFDLDPSGAEFSAVKAAARAARGLLEEVSLPAYLKTTGSRGLHVVVPLDRKAPFDDVRAFARMLAEALVARAPDQCTLEQRKNKRRNRVFIDINRNAYGQTVAPAYAVRARDGAPVAVPLAWDELEHDSVAPDRWTIRNVFSKLESCEDPWKDFFRRACSLHRARTKLEALDAARRVPQETQVRRNTRARGA
jgi:bifunctional non-homologous end joining protein LigD